MSKEILSEIKLLRAAVVRLIGSSGLPEEDQLSPAVLDKAEKEFKRLRTMSDQWLSESDLPSYFKSESPYGNIGKFIIDEFKFTNYFVDKRSYYYYKSDIVSLAEELKTRNVNLSRYIEFKSEERQFIKNIQTAFNNKKANKGMPYWLSELVQNVELIRPPRPTIEFIETDIERLRVEFDSYKLSEYIDIYNGNFAMMKSD